MSFSFKTLIKILSKEDLILIAQTNPDLDQICLKLNLNKFQVRYLYRKLGISLRFSKTKATSPLPIAESFSKEMLQSLQKETLQSVCKTLNLKPKKVYALYASHGLKAPIKQSNYCTACPVSKEELDHLYTVLKTPLRKIGSLYGVSGQAVSNWMKFYNIPLRSRGNFKSAYKKKKTNHVWNMPKEEFLQRISKYESQADFCKSEKISVQIYKEYIHLHNIKNRFEKQRMQVTKEEFEELYINQNMTLLQLSERYGVHIQTICRYTKKFGLRKT